VASFVADGILEARKSYIERNEAQDRAEAEEKASSIIIEEAVIEQVEDVVEKKIKKPDVFEAKMKKKIPMTKEGNKVK